MQLYKKMAFLLSLGIMGVGMLTFTTSRPKLVSGKELGSVSDTGTADSSSGETAEGGVSDGGTSAPTATPAPTSTPTPTPLPPNDLTEIAEITKVVKEYYTAKLTPDAETLEKLHTNPALLNLDAMTVKMEYIKDYENISVLTKWIEGEFDYVAYVSYEIVIPTIDSHVPSFDEVYIKKTGDGQYKIYNDLAEDDLSPATKDTLDEYRNSEEVLKIADEIGQKLMEIVEADSEVLEMIEKMENVIGRESSDESGDSQESGSPDAPEAPAAP